MKKGKKWMALTGALAISVIALTGGSGAKAVQADASDEEVFMNILQSYTEILLRKL